MRGEWCWNDAAPPALCAHYNRVQDRDLCRPSKPEVTKQLASRARGKAGHRRDGERYSGSIRLQLVPDQRGVPPARGDDAADVAPMPGPPLGGSDWTAFNSREGRPAPGRIPDRLCGRCERDHPRSYEGAHPAPEN